jgi:hypothetical protein
MSMKIVFILHKCCKRLFDVANHDELTFLSVKAKKERASRGARSRYA